MKLKINLNDTGLNKDTIAEMREASLKALESVWSGKIDFTGWVDDPNAIGQDTINDILNTARDIRSKADYFIVLGVGGSFMGAKAVIDVLNQNQSKTEVIFAGYNFSGRYINEIISKIKDKDICLCVVSKSGSTTETLSAYGIFKELMASKYSEEEAAKRTYMVTETRPNPLYDEAKARGCKTFDLPVDIGGRYSVLTPVGLLPIAVAGIDVDAIIKGARSIASMDAFKAEGTLDYAIARNLLYNKGKRIEVFEFFDPYFSYVGEWLKQLFGESEGKEGKGLFPVSLMFSRDLHSMGQFLQQGTDCFFETFITIEKPLEDIEIPKSAVKPFAGKTIEQINRCAEQGVLAAHVKAGVPAISIVLPDISEETVGEMLYYFEMECAVSALISGVDPFNQPGVEAYKKEMKDYINKLD